MNQSTNFLSKGDIDAPEYKISVNIDSNCSSVITEIVL